ncbi:DUF551 domain-containing protein [Salmonella enterica]
MTTKHPAHGPVSLDRLHQIREILSKAAAQSDGGNLGYAMADAVKVIDGAIAAFGAEPVADVVAWNREGEERTCDIRLRRFDLAPGPLFAVAQPAPVVPDEREAFNVWNNDTDCPLAGLNVKQAAWLAWLKRSGTIKSFEPATDEFEVWARSEGLIHDSYGLRTVNTSADVARKAWNACRAAMLQGADGKPELTVWYGSMPETNGKTNWTAMLHRKGQHPWEGITIDCSEYPDRVRYEADRMRHLIGELADEPDILAYDADAHSGYVNPGNSPVTPDGWVACVERMPSAGEQVLAYRPDAPESNDPLIKMATYVGGSAHGHGFDCYCKPTHWMPLPAAPQQEVKP